jgi:3'-phosphoadenosine 5'-phosphosulfate (PAPS) 3'-phosphatase
MATHRLIHVTRTGGDTDGLAEFTDSDTVLLPVHSSDPTGTTEGEMIYNSTDDKIKIYNGSSWEVVGNTTENIQDIVAGQLVTNGTHSGISFTYDDSTDGGINATVSADSTAIVDGDSDTKIQVDEGSADEDKIRYDVAGTEVAVQDAGGIALTTNGGMFRHNQTQAATFTIPSGEGTLLAGPVTITGTVTNNGTMVVI